MFELVLDISKYDDIDLERWKRERGLWAVIIKCGGNEGGRYKDSKFEEHYANAIAAGLHVGFYYYTTVTNVAEANVDANHMRDIIGDRFYDMPWYMDVEDPAQFALSARALTDVIKSFCNTLNYNGIYSGLYTNGSAWLNNMYCDELMDYANWIAWWRSEWPHEAGDIGLWQQGGMNIYGTIVFDDLPGFHDCDWCVVDYPSRIDNGQVKPEPEPDRPHQKDSEPLTQDGFAYRAYCEAVGWQSPVRDGQVAGTEGYSTRLEALKFRPTPAMGTLDADIHMADIGWKTFAGIKAGDASGEGSSDIDPICGTINEWRRIEAIRLKLHDDNKTGRKLRYMGHVEGIGWQEPVWEGEICGTTGQSLRLEAVRIWLDDPSNPIDIHKHEEEEPMGRATDVIDAAYGELGYYAPDDPEPGSKYGRWMTEITGEDWMAGPSSEIWWCCMFVSWCLDQGNVQMDGFPTQNTDLALAGGADAYAVDIYDVRYGDIVIFNWDWDSTTDHIGFATGEFDGTGFPTIEGNIGNAVREKYRQMGNVAYVLRPNYGAYGSHGHNTPSVSNDPKNNRDGGKLEVDGIGGWNTVIDLQHALGTEEDGWISGQDPANWEYHSGMSNVEYSWFGSPLVKALQHKIGSGADGHWGPDTSRKLQQWLVDKGYKIDVDGYFGRESVKALQQSLNDGKWN